MAALFDTIVAPITSLDGAVAVVRLSGPESFEVASQVFAPWPANLKPRYAYYGEVLDSDDGLCIAFEEGHGYTGERSVELSLHGSRASVQALLEACFRLGARLARPGEFTERAFLHGRLDLTQAEGVRDTVAAQTRSQLHQARRLISGEFRESIEELRKRVLAVLAAIEASVDFSEEVGDLDRDSARKELIQIEETLEKFLRTAQAGRLLRRGRRIAIVGPPNAGKSSLLNALLGFERAIVTPIPGTTRDFVEEPLDLGGIPCVLTDTAGLREAADPIEKIGVERAWKAAAEADEVWFVYDASVGFGDAEQAAVDKIEHPLRILCSKCDLAPCRVSEHLAVSSKSREGLAEFIAIVAAEAAQGEAQPQVWINERHEPLLISARQSLSEARGTLGLDLPFDLATVHLQAALQALGEVTGESASPDVIESLFSTFCIGK